MTITQIRPRSRDLVVDLFAGGAGASTGIAAALGKSPDIAINHSLAAVAMHTANHPKTKHYKSDVWDVDPRKAVGRRRVGLLWASPDCRHFSRAKGGVPVSKGIRSLTRIYSHAVAGAQAMGAARAVGAYLDRAMAGRPTIKAVR